MNNKRLQQIVWMFSYITGQPIENARDIILQTETGKAVQAENPIVMYEQQSENISSIAMELRNYKSYEALVDLFTVTAIVQAMQSLKNMEKQDEKHSVAKSIVIASNPDLKAMDKVQKQAARKNVLQIKKQNQMNARRIERANKLKG